MTIRKNTSMKSVAWGLINKKTNQFYGNSRGQPWTFDTRDLARHERSRFAGPEFSVVKLEETIRVI